MYGFKDTGTQTEHEARKPRYSSWHCVSPNGFIDEFIKVNGGECKAGLGLWELPHLVRHETSLVHQVSCCANIGSADATFLHRLPCRSGMPLICVITSQRCDVIGHKTEERGREKSRPQLNTEIKVIPKWLHFISGFHYLDETRQRSDPLHQLRCAAAAVGPHPAVLLPIRCSVLHHLCLEGLLSAAFVTEGGFSCGRLPNTAAFKASDHPSSTSVLLCSLGLKYICFLYPDSLPPLRRGSWIHSGEAAATLLRNAADINQHLLHGVFIWKWSGHILHQNVQP